MLSCFYYITFWLVCIGVFRDDLKKFARNKVSEISGIAANSFGLKFCRDSFSLQLKLLIEQIKFIEDQVSDVEKEINVILEKIDSPITTIPSIANTNAALFSAKSGISKDFQMPQN